MKLNSILAHLGLDPADSGEMEIDGISGLAEATRSQISYACGVKQRDDLEKSQAAAVFVTEKLKPYVGSGTLAIVVENPELSVAETSRLFRPHFDLPQPGTQDIDPTTVIFPNVAIGSNVIIGRNCRIMSGAYIGDGVVIGDETVIHPNVVVYHHCHVGSRCAIHANTVIGSDGFGYAHTSKGEHVKIEQLGNVVVEDDVEIGSNTSIDRATFKSTTIRRGSKIDNLVHISHNVEIGEHSIIAGQTGIAGSTTLGRNVVMAAQSGATGHIKIADFTTVAARGGVTKNTEPGKTYAGFPIMEHGLWLKFQAKLARLVKQKA